MEELIISLDTMTVAMDDSLFAAVVILRTKEEFDGESVCFFSFEKPGGY